jgi:hypothetical protein
MRSAALSLLLALAVTASAQKVEVDITACRAMFEVMTAMHGGASRVEVERKLDAVLATRAYRVMSAHYNRSWRPGHLPGDVFRRMILSLRFADAYRVGENERADQMRVRWARFYADLPAYEKRLRQLEAVDLQELIGGAVRFAQTWLPAGWKIPDSYFAIAPNGGSPAFSIDGSQGYDFFQLPEDEEGRINLQEVARTIGHESHHLGMQTAQPASLTPAETVAFQVLSITIAEGAATRFVSGAPAGCAPAVAGERGNGLSPELTAAWKAHAAGFEGIMKHQTVMLERALAGELSEEGLSVELREYWLNGKIGRAYVLGAEMFGAIYYALGTEAVFAAMKDPRRLFALYNAALDAKPGLRCPRVPEDAVERALSIGKGGVGEKAP